MSLFYQIAFAHDSPEPAPLIQQLATEWGPTVTVIRETEHRLVVLQHDEWLLSLTITTESGHFELSFGEYAYLSDWYIELGKADGLAAMRFYIELVGKLVTEYTYDFLSIFNGERVVLKREKDNLCLNTESSVWKKQESLAVLGNHPYSMATYPVNY
jgi:hypothetical protein